MRIFEILMLAADAIVLMDILSKGHYRTGDQAELSPEADNSWMSNQEAINSGMNNFWVRGSLAGWPQPVKHETRSAAAGIILPVLSVAFAIISILTEGFRLFMIPAYLLTVILLLNGIIRAILKKHEGQ